MKWLRNLCWAVLGVGVLVGCSGGDSPAPQASSEPNTPSAAVAPLQKEVQDNTKGLAETMKASMPAQPPAPVSASASASVAVNPELGETLKNVLVSTPGGQK